MKGNMKYIKGLPTEPGWYWRRMTDVFSKEVESAIVHIRSYAGKLAIGNSTLEGWEAMAEAEWAGPIPEPGTPSSTLLEDRQALVKEIALCYPNHTGMRSILNALAGLGPLPSAKKEQL